METCPIEAVVPDFGGADEVRRLASPLTPRELYRALLSPDEHVGAFEPAYRFACAALDRVAATARELAAPGEAQQFLGGLLARAEQAGAVAVPERFVSTWPARVARELAPLGLVDGAWLHGAARVNVVESEVGMLLLKQLMIRFGDPGTRESYAERYAMLLRSIGVAPPGIARWEFAEAHPCSDLSYEHPLLGLALGLFPSSFFPETVGYNLYLAAAGPWRLLRALAGRLGERACTRYLDDHDTAELRRLALAAARGLLSWSPTDQLRERLARGFLAALRASSRWAQAMCGGGVPRTAEDAVLDMFRRKARFAADHHPEVVLGGQSVAELLRGGEAEHRALLARLAVSPLIEPGDPDASLLITHSLAATGPMFEAFTATEVQELREWIAELEPARGPSPPPPAPRLEPEGSYHPLQDEDSLARFAEARYSALAPHELLFHLVNADRWPAIRLHARRHAESTLARIDATLASDPSLRDELKPAYSEQVVAELMARHHERNLQWRQQPQVALEARWQETLRAEPTLLPLDGCWLQGFIDVYRSGLEEYGWLFRIYASEQGDGNIDWNHNRIYRLCFAPDDVRARAQTTSMELYDAYRDHFLGGVLLKVALSLHTRRFLPELLGLNLANEASGVGGTYLYYAQRFAQEGDVYRALDFSLHNCIDNYASGHTRWSIAAVQAFQARVEAVAPAATEEQWRRIWRFLRLGQIFDHGTPAQRRALAGLWLPPAP